MSFRSAQTSTLNAATASVADLESALNALHTIHQVDVAHMGGSGLIESDAMCASGGRTIQITFLTEHGDVPLLRGHSTDGVLVTVNEHTTGTKEDAPCNNRGFCVSDPNSHWGGQCRCVDNRIVKFSSSDGMGENDGLMGDCGKRTADFDSKCPVSQVPYDAENFCSGHGTCHDSGPSPTYACTCYEGWTGHNCEQRTCPYGKAWFSVPASTNDAHVMMECSNRGICDRETGMCVCQDIFEGKACERLSCPKGHINGKTCSGYGVCATMAEMAEHFRTINGELVPTVYGAIANNVDTWDAHKLQGCMCSSRSLAYASPATGHVPRWTGFDCSIRGCPTGPRPVADRETCSDDFETQTIVCTADAASSITATFRDETSVSFPTDVAADGELSLQVYVESLRSIGRVNVSYSPGKTEFCTTDGSNEVTITFLTELGDVPDVTFDHAASDGALVSISNTESVKGTKEALECSQMGTCDRQTGQCMCFDGYASSDADGRRGTRGDCGFVV